MFKLKTIVYNTLGSLVLFAPFALALYIIINIFNSDNFGNNFFIFPKICISLLIIAIACIIVSLYTIANDGFFEDNISILLYRKYLYSLNRTKLVYHSDYGNFECITDKDSNELIVYNQNFLMLERIGSLYVSDDLNYMTSRIKDIIELEMNKRNVSKKSRDNKADILRKWDGYLDTEGKRDDKINKILR